MLKAIIREQQLRHGDPDEVIDVSDGIPGSLKSVVALLGIKPSLRSFVCCPTCFACYGKDDHPLACTYHGAPDLPACGTALLTERKRKGHVVTEPERMLHLQDFRHWLGQLLCRPGMEDTLDRNVYDTGAGPGELLDIWDGHVLRNFCGPDGKNFISAKESSTCRLVFAVCMDGFNPFFNKHGGKSYSSGVISLICLNLPPASRHLLENIFVFCVYPGPHEPKLDNINNVLTYLVDDFLPFWEPGVYYSSTPKYPGGRLVNAAMVPLLGDLLAARKMSGITRLCTQCPLKAKDFDNIDESTWPKPHTSEEHRRLADEWRQLDSKGRKTHHHEHGIRWSALLRLPYWDPVTYTVVELSHNLLGVNAQHHLRVIFGMNANLPDGLGEQMQKKKKSNSEPDPSEIIEAWEKVTRAPDSVVKDITGRLLKECCAIAGIPTGGKHNIMLKTLLQWVRCTIKPHLTQLNILLL